MDPDKRIELGKLGQKHVQENYSFENFGKQWVNLMSSVYENYGSHETRKNYKNIKVQEL
jgi:hypothetical protein